MQKSTMNFKEITETVGNILEITSLRCDLAAMKLRFKASNLKSTLSYRCSVRPFEDQLATEKLNLWSGDLLSFFKSDLYKVQEILGLDSSQRAAFARILAATEEGTLLLTQQARRVSGQGEPCLVNRYEIPQISLGGPWDRKISATLNTSWNIAKRRPDHFIITGNNGHLTSDWCHFVDFLSLPFKPTTADELKSVIGAGIKGHECFLDVDRITIESPFTSGGEKLIHTAKYYLVGAFEGRIDGLSSWIYGSNSNSPSTTRRVRDLREFHRQVDNSG